MATTATANLQPAALGACSDNANTSYGATFVKKGRFTTILSNENTRTNQKNSHRMLNSSQKIKWWTRHYIFVTAKLTHFDKTKQPVNDLDLNVHNVLLKFADDTKVYSRICNSDNVKKLQEDLNTLQEWAHAYSGSTVCCWVELIYTASGG